MSTVKFHLDNNGLISYKNNTAKLTRKEKQHLTADDKMRMTDSFITRHRVPMSDNDYHRVHIYWQTVRYLTGNYKSITIGYQRKNTDTQTHGAYVTYTDWNGEVKTIVDKSFNKLYTAICNHIENKRAVNQ